MSDSVTDGPNRLTLLCRGKTLGFIAVRENNGRRIIGDFSPGPSYAEFAPLCELMAEWAQKFITSSQVDYEGDLDPYWAWDKWMEAIEQLGVQGLSIPELGRSVEEFSLDHDGEATIFV